MTSLNLSLTFAQDRSVLRIQTTHFHTERPRLSDLGHYPGIFRLWHLRLLVNYRVRRSINEFSKDPTGSGKFKAVQNELDTLGVRILKVIFRNPVPQRAHSYTLGKGDPRAKDMKYKLTSHCKAMGCS